MPEKSKSGLEKIVLAGIGALATTAEKSAEMLDELVKRGELTIEQGKTRNEELKHTVKTTLSETGKPADDAVSDVINNFDKLTSDELAI